MENRSPLPIILAALVVAGVAFVCCQPAAPAPVAPVCPGPNCPITPTPPTPAPKPKPPRCPNCPQESFAPIGAGGSVVDGRVHDGQPITADLPGQFWMKNIPSHKNGAGMCVTTAIEMAGRYQGVPGIVGFRDWCAREDGGAGPPKVDDQLKRYYREKFNAEPPSYFQYEGRDPAPILQQIDANGWMACHTYGTSPRYNGQTIHHMVCGPCFREKYATVLDSNFIDPLEGSFEWMTPEEALRRIGHGGTSWVFCWLEPGPPAAPHN